MDELGDALRLKGFNPTSKELVKLGRELDTDRSGEIGTLHLFAHISPLSCIFLIKKEEDTV